ncbi:Gfo/Idh/MocA family oxidoreductase [Tateyamaria sp.]|nr:Gfo/Idh/MocA family oxidoreductase [Tateyamaria sp.]
MNVLMIGLGMVAHTHLLALRDNRASLKLDAVLGRDKQMVRTFCDSAAAILGYDVLDFTEISDALSIKPDLAVVLTPPNARLEYAQVLSKAGIPTILEKPIERTLDSSRIIVEMFEAADVPLGVFFQHRARPAAVALKELLNTSALGDIIHLEMRVPWWRDQLYYDSPGRGTYDRDGGGVMINQAIHTLDLALWLAGPITQVQAIMRTSPLHQMEAEDIAAALMGFASGASGVLSATTIAYPGSADSIAITTMRAEVILQGNQLNIFWHDGHIETIVSDQTNSTGGGVDPMAFTHAWHQAILEDFVQFCEMGGEAISSGRSALHVHAVIQAMEKAVKSGIVARVVS